MRANKIMFLDKRTLLNYLLLPISWLFYLISTIRRYFYKLNILKTYKFNKPIIVVGNITIGGSGKTPIVIYLVKFFQKKGKKVGIVSRGYGRTKNSTTSHLVDEKSQAFEVGDEPLLIFKLTNAIVMVNKNRPQAVNDLIKNYNVDLIISDDGLQHYAMDRDIEICVHNDNSNSFLLPAGGLRERVSRLKEFDFVIKNKIKPICFINAKTKKKQELNYFNGQKSHAVAGIGKPNRFFKTLTSLNIDIIKHPFADHYSFQEKDLVFNDDYPIIMSAKDWVKCSSFATINMWYLDIEANLDKEFLEKLEMKI